MGVGDFLRRLLFSNCLRARADLVLVARLINAINQTKTMTKSLLKLSLLGLLAVAVAGLPVCAGAAETNAPTAGKKASKTKKSSTLPIHGKLKAVDNTAKTISVGEQTIQITSETKISKGDKPATLEDGVVGEEVSGAYKKGEDGKLTATKLRFGPKAETTEKSSKAGKKKEKTKTD
jgi:hypothetical protein